jgi:hypothetical protein
MSTTEPRQASDIDRDIETLRDDELDAVTGGSFDLGNIVGSIAKSHNSAGVSHRVCSHTKMVEVLKSSKLTWWSR